MSGSCTRHVRIGNGGSSATFQQIYLVSVHRCQCLDTCGYSSLTLGIIHGFDITHWIVATDLSSQMIDPQSMIPVFMTWVQPFMFLINSTWSRQETYIGIHQFHSDTSVLHLINHPPSFVIQENECAGMIAYCIHQLESSHKFCFFSQAQLPLGPSQEHGTLGLHFRGYHRQETFERFEVGHQSPWPVILQHATGQNIVPGRFPPE